ncbi:hypothetical protein KAI54_00750 [Candidatus Gracilibacteria bacterium]|nr:hypothetical protein [Candidatus Gracilibacteria bacterium]
MFTIDKFPDETENDPKKLKQALRKEIDSSFFDNGEKNNNFLIHDFCEKAGENLGHRFDEFIKGDVRFCVIRLLVKHANLIKENKAFFDFTKGVSFRTKGQVILMLKRKAT